MLISTILLTGCVSNTGVVPIGEDTYMIGKSTNLALTSSGIKADSFKEASRYCEKLNKKIQIISTTATDMKLGSHVGSTEIQFMCLTEGDSELNRPKLRKTPDQVVEVKSNVRVQSKGFEDMYTELKKLNDLKKSGILTQKEFDIEKKNILAR
jgi:N-acetyl-gamma-glutamylphosphate reductase